MSQRAPKEQPPLKDLQRALTISAFDIAQNDGKITFQGCAELSNEKVFRSQLPPPEPSYTRVLILEAPFSIDNPGVREAMPDWFKQPDELESTSILNFWDLENIWAGKENYDSSRTFRTDNYHVVKPRTKPSGNSFIQETAYLEAQFLSMGPLESDRIYFWRYSASVDASYTDNGALELICRFPLIPEYYDMKTNKTAKSDCIVIADPDTTLAVPLKSAFLTRLLAKNSATQSCCQDTETSAMTVLMDLFMASVACHTSIIASFSECTPGAAQQPPVLKQFPIIHIATTARIIEGTVRHIQEWLDISIGKPESTDDLRNRRMKILNRHIENRLTDMNIHLQFWMEVVDLWVSNNVAYLDGIQAQSVKRLTLLATIFLPISLAASLLSMSTRAADLGSLWYDYFGISVIALFLVSMGYYCLFIWDRIQIFEMKGIVSLGLALIGIRHVKRMKWRVLIPLFFLLFVISTLVSFFVGMAKGIPLGLHILAYSAAITVGSLLILNFIDFVKTVYTAEGVH